MDKDILSKVKSFFMGKGKTVDPLAAEMDDPASGGSASLEMKAPAPSTIIDSSTAAMVSVMGSIGWLGDYYFPPDLIGGCCPRVLGEEQDIVWNAAAEASDTERVHIAWQAKGEKIWYLAVRSSDMSSHANTWCPFASLLPGMKDSVDPPIVYTYFSDESATMMTIMMDGLQIHRGTSSVIRAKAERVSRELGNAPVVELVPDRIRNLTPVPWYSVSLFEERTRRILAAVSVFAAIVVAGLSVFVWLIATMSVVSSRADLREIQERADKKSLELLKSVQNERASPMREQIATFTDVNDGLLNLNGYLEIYQIDEKKAQWRAVVPANVTSDRINELGGQTIDNNTQGVVISNVKDAMSIGKEQRKRR